MLSEAPIRGPPFNPGAGGWPTIRYFNKETGPDGAPYAQKTKDAMCTELLNDQYMQGFITEFGKTTIPAAEAAAPEAAAEEKKEEL